MNEIRSGRSATERVLGGSVVGVLVRLLVMSFVVGLILRALDITPVDVIAWFERTIASLSALSLSTLGEFGSILLLGAVIVVPIWLLLRVLKLLSR